MALDDKKLDQGKPADSDGATATDQSDSSTPSEGDTKPDKGSDSWELNINGKVQKFNESELIEIVSKGLYYTQKTQMLADEKKKFEPYSPFINKMETDKEFANQVIEFVSDLESQTQSSDSGADPQIKAQLLGLQQQLSDLTMNSQFDELETKYGKKIKIDRVEIADYARANNITSPEVALLMLKGGALEEAAIQEGIKIGKDGGGDKSRVLVHPGKAGNKSPPKVDVTKMSAKDKRTMSIERLESM